MWCSKLIFSTIKASVGGFSKILKFLVCAKPKNKIDFKFFYIFLALLNRAFCFEVYQNKLNKLEMID